MIHDGYVYIAGGIDQAAAPYDDVQFAPLNSNGTLGAWSTTATIPEALYYPSLSGHGEHLYLTGGYDTGYLDSTIRARFVP